MKHFLSTLWWVGKITFGCIVFAAGFSLFLLPNNLNVGGLSGLSMVLVHLLGIGSVGTVTILMNLPLFALGGIKIGKTFFIGSLIGVFLSSVALDFLQTLPAPQTEPLLGAVYGGVLCGLGLGIVYAVGASTGGTDIVVRLVKRKMQGIPIGAISTCLDLFVAVLTGITFHDISSCLYSGVAIFIAGRVLDAVVYRFDYSIVALIISSRHEAISQAIAAKLDRGATYLHGQGTYTNLDREVILTAVKRQQIAELKQLVVEIDPNAFIILQEAHQVLGDGFSRYSKESL